MVVQMHLQGANASLDTLEKYFDADRQGGHRK